MKTNKRTLAMLTAGLLALTPCFTAGMLTAEAATITVNKATGDTAAHTYKAYPIITGTADSTEKVLSDMTWSSGINLSTLETELKALDSAFSSFDASTTTPAQFAAMANSYATTDAKKQALAKVFNETGVITGSGTALSDGNNTANPYTATGLADGWYVIIDESASSSLEHSAYSANILEVKGSAAINPKYSLPTLDKKIVDYSSEVEANEESIGGTVSYKLTTAVPDMTGYNKYFFVINDTLSSGLTFNASSVVVTMGGTELTKDADYEIQTGEAAEGNTFQIVFKNFIEKKANSGEAIVVTYNATLNENADISNSGNPNTANLEYSNNPNHNYTGGTAGTPNGPDEPETDAPTGITPNEIVKTYTTAIKIKKVDESNNALSGATFTLTSSDGAVKTVITIKDTFVESDSPTVAYYKLKTGLYTTTAPDGENDGLYESTTQMYEKTTITANNSSTANTSATCEVGTDGIAVFKGLGAGSYTLTESGTPSGYNTISPITFTIGNSSAPTTSAPNWSLTPSADFTLDDNMYAITIENVKGAQLPTTGGIGTKLFYVFGGMLVVGSSVVLITKKRMSADEK